MVTTTGDLTGAVGWPILEYHHIDGLVYTDFMEIYYVNAPEAYAANDFKSVSDIQESGATTTASNVFINLPIVPSGATLQHPVTKGTNVAPISETLVWYKGQEVWMYAFEVTDQTAADYFANTRDDPADSDYAITVQPNLVNGGNVLAIPLWHMNQFSRGIVEGENGGGPDLASPQLVLDLPMPLQWLTLPFAFLPRC